MAAAPPDMHADPSVGPTVGTSGFWIFLAQAVDTDVAVGNVLDLGKVDRICVDHWMSCVQYCNHVGSIGIVLGRVVGHFKEDQAKFHKQLMSLVTERW